MINLLILIFIIAIIIFIADKLFSVKDDETTEKINEILPQANCGKCGYAGCKQFAKALINNEADINMCHLLNGLEKKQIAKLTGLKSNSKKITEVKVAVIDESKCIGCTKCILNCPTDCIIGSAKKAHTVIEDNCSGCEICVSNCPVGAITMKTKTKTD